MLTLPFGTPSAYTDSFPAPPPKQITINAETCFNVLQFKEMVRQYRKLDDQIITRLNRAQAQYRDQFRTASAPSSSSKSTITGPQGMCADLWYEMMSGWAHRQTLLSYCVATVKASAEDKKPTSTADERLSQLPPRTDRDRRDRGWREAEVLANQLSNEESIEAIIRKRSLDAFKSRCQYFQPPPTDTAGRAWWDLADSGRIGKGPEVL